MPIADIFNIIFFFIFAIYIFLGAYIFFLNQKSGKNIAFFFLLFSLAIWSLSFALISSAPTIEEAFFWRRVSTWGWGITYSILLHLVLLLSENGEWIKKRWFVFLIYLPALINVLVFSLIEPLVRANTILVQSPFGWSTVGVNSIYDKFFNIYYISFTALSLGIILRWQLRISAKRKKGAMLFLVSVLSALVLGTISDIILKNHFHGQLPQMGPIFILFPIMAIAYSIKHYELFDKLNPDKSYASDEILSEEGRKKIYFLFSCLLIAGSLINFLASYVINGNSLYEVIILSSLLLVLAFAVQALSFFDYNEKYREISLAFILSFAILFTAFSFVDNGSITVWVYPVIFMFLATVFKNRYLIYVLGFFMLGAQVAVWRMIPRASVLLDSSDHLSRIFFYCLIIILSVYVNKLYLDRLRDNEQQFRLQKLISEISAEFISVKPENLDEKIRNVFRKVGLFFEIDHACLILFSKDGSRVEKRIEWYDYQKNGKEILESEINEEKLLSICETCLQKDILQFSNNETDFSEDIKSIFTETVGIKNNLFLPVFGKEKIIGMMNFDSISAAKEWTENQLDSLKILANILSDALLKVNAEMELEYLAYYDSLTGLPNRNNLKIKLDRAIELGQENGKKTGIVFLDLDSFKMINDTVGHENGDLLLREMGKRIVADVRQENTISRFGGDEFLILCPSIENKNEIKIIVERLLKSLGRPIVLENQEFFITASCGIAISPEDGKDAETLIKNADLAMNYAKENGKNRYLFCNREMKEKVKREMKLTHSLYRALENDELIIHYQPQISLESGKIIGVEALLRWQHPEEGNIPPSTFIPLAEKTGLINQIGRWVLENACKQNKAWQDAGLPPLCMAVNISVEQLRNPNLKKIVADILEFTGLEARYLELEVTESVIIKESESILAALNELKGLGVSISIDDFGTEYSSLSRLKQMPIDRIKIAMEFVQGLFHDSKDEAIAKIIINLAKSLNLRVIAEGVETEEQLRFLSEKYCDDVQGYYFYKALPAEEIVKLIV